MRLATPTQPRVSYSDADRLVERAVGDPERCPWCFARRRRYHPDVARREAEELRWGATKQTLDAKGHTIQEDGTLAVNTAVSDADPSTFQDVVPDAWIDGEYHPPRPQTICSCGVVDYGDDDDRSLSEIHTSIDNLVEWYDELDLSAPAYPDDINEQAAHDMATRLRGYDIMSGADRLVIAESLRRGLSKCLS